MAMRILLSPRVLTCCIILLNCSSVGSSFIMYRLFISPAEPACFPLISFLVAPTIAGSILSYVVGSLIMASVWMPDSCANAFFPTIALLGWTFIPVTRQTVLLVSVILFRVIPVFTLYSSSSATAVSSREAFPALSPIPFMVAWMWVPPAAIPAMVLATASPKSLWQWMPRVIWGNQSWISL